MRQAVPIQLPGHVAPGQSALDALGDSTAPANASEAGRGNIVGLWLATVSAGRQVAFQGFEAYTQDGRVSERQRLAHRGQRLLRHLVAGGQEHQDPSSRLEL